MLALLTCPRRNHVRKTCRRIALNTCFECGFPAEHNHHVVPKSMGGKNTVPLCQSCHNLIHSVGNSMSRGNIHRSSMISRRPSKLTWTTAIKILILRSYGKSIRKIQKELPDVSTDTIHRAINGEGSLPNAIREMQKMLCDQCIMSSSKM
jgi:hypothetical protein